MGDRTSKPRSALQATARLCFETAPALFAVLLLSAGILSAGLLWIVPGILLLATLLFAALSLLAARSAPRVALLPLACCWLLLGLFLREVQPAPDPQTALTVLAENGGQWRVEGEITRTTPVLLTRSELPFSNVAREEKSESIDIRIRSVAGQPIAGGLRATLYGPADQSFPAIHCGDSIQSPIAMHLPERYLDPGVWDSTAWLREQGIGAIGSLKVSALRITRSSAHAPLACWLHSWQQAGTERLLAFADSPQGRLRMPGWLRLNREDAGMLSAMILGDRTYLERQARIGFERTGSFHLLVVSGMHLAIFAGLIFSLAALLRLPRLWSTIATIVCSLCYALLTGFGDPVQRSLWMVTLFLIARLLFRERSSLNAVGFAALCLLAWNPRSLLDASFQMTLLSVLILAGLVLPIAERTFAPYLRASRNPGLVALDPGLPPRIAQFRVTLRLIAGRLQPLLGRRIAESAPSATVRLALTLCELLLVSATIELAMSLPMAAYFHRITALGLPVNILVVPLIGLALPAALVTFAAILAIPAVGAVPASIASAVTAALLHAITGIVHLFGSMAAADIRISTPDRAAVAVGILLIGFAVWAARNSRFPITLPLLALALSAVAACFPRPLAYHPGVLEITAIDVGQGDSLLLVSPQGKTLLIDAGGPIGGVQASTSNFEIGEDVVSPVLWGRNIRHLDAVALTHAHSDHMGGMFAVLKNFRPNELWVGKNPMTPAYRALLAEAGGLGIRVRSFSAGDSFDFAGTHIDVLSPARNYVPGAAASNDDSLVLHVAYGQTSALLEGDAEAPSEARMLSEPLHSDLLKIGHHGSKTSTTPPFLAAVDPAFAVISVGHRNPYGHPRIEVLEHLQADHVRTFRTDAMGATSFFLNGKMVSGQALAAGQSP